MSSEGSITPRDLVDEIDRVRVEDVARAHRLRDAVGLPHAREGGLCADQIAERPFDAVVLDKATCRGRRVANGIDAHRDERDATRLVAQAISSAADRLRRQRTDIDAARVEEREEDDLPAKPGERDRLAARPIGEREIGGDRPWKRLADERCWRAGDGDHARDEH